MPRTRFDINSDDVLEMLKDKKRYPTITSIARKLGCSRAIIRRIRDGTRTKPREVTIVEDEKCECCGIRPKKEGFRYLCNSCFKQKGYLTDVEEAEISRRIYKIGTDDGR